MSNALAVPAVTAAITSVLQTRIDRAGISPRPLVAPVSLEGDGTTPFVGVHLYRVTRNGSLDNDDLPTRSGASVLLQRPRTALDLHYLLTFRGSDAYEAERLLALAAAALHAVPCLTPAIVAAATTAYPDVTGNDLATAAEPVRVTPEPVPFDEVTKLWALYEPGAFTPTLAYVAGPVVVDSDDTPGTALPVRRFAAGARVLSAPRLDAVAGPLGAGAPVRAESPMPAVRLLGAALAPGDGEDLAVLVDGTAVAPVTVVSDTELSCQLPALAPGPHAVQVRRVGAALDPAVSTTRPAATSETRTFVVLPTLQSASAATVPGTDPGERSGTVTATVRPALDSDQRVRLLLDSQGVTPPVALALPVTVPAGPPRTSIDATVADVPGGTYRVTLEVDGVRSIPPTDPAGHYVLTVVTL